MALGDETFALGRQRAGLVLRCARYRRRRTGPQSRLVVDRRLDRDIRHRRRPSHRPLAVRYVAPPGDTSRDIADLDLNLDLTDRTAVVRLAPDSSLTVTDRACIEDTCLDKYAFVAALGL